MHEGRPGSESIRRRTLLSEVAFIALPGNAGWLGFRRVLKVDDAPVFDTLGALTATLASGLKEDYARARIMLNESARFNLGKPRAIIFQTCRSNYSRFSTPAGFPSASRARNASAATGRQSWCWLKTSRLRLSASSMAATCAASSAPSSSPRPGGSGAPTCSSGSRVPPSFSSTTSCR